MRNSFLQNVGAAFHSKNVSVAALRHVFFPLPLRGMALAHALSTLPSAVEETQVRKWRARSGIAPGDFAAALGKGDRLRMRFQPLLRAREARAPRCRRVGSLRASVRLPETSWKCPGWERSGGSPREPAHSHGCAVAVAKLVGTCPRFPRGCAGRRASPFPESLCSAKKGRFPPLRKSPAASVLSAVRGVTGADL